jgi:membrane protein CcdC involved in cytochrome C biogenesis
VLSLVAIIFFFHIWQLGALPRGVFIDEASTGYSAYQIAHIGHDEHGEFLPIFFRSFNDYKGPLYIYATALLGKVFGFSVFIVRLPAALYFMLLLWGFVMLGQRMCTPATQHKILLTSYCLLAAGFLPWLFPLSRIAFEANGLPALTMLALFWLYRAHTTGKTGSGFSAAVAGSLIGLLPYTYNSGKLLGPLLLVTSLGLFLRPSKWKTGLMMVIAFCVVVIPFAHFSYYHNKENTERFRLLTYVYDEGLSTQDKLSQFADTYISHWSPSFLLAKGDGERRHATGHGGELTWIVFTFALLGLLAYASERKYRRQPFVWLLFVNLLLAGVPAALTKGDVPHALRSVNMSVYLLLFSCIGVAFLIDHAKKAALLLWLPPMIVLAGESALYLHHYFTVYPKTSEQAFWSYGIEDGLLTALDQHPDRVLIAEGMGSGWDFHNLRFYRTIVPNYAEVPMEMVNVQKLNMQDVPESCFLLTEHERNALFTQRLNAPISHSANFGKVFVECFGKERQAPPPPPVEGTPPPPQS